MSVLSIYIIMGEPIRTYPPWYLLVDSSVFDEVLWASKFNFLFTYSSVFAVLKRRFLIPSKNFTGARKDEKTHIPLQGVPHLVPPTIWDYYSVRDEATTPSHSSSLNIIQNTRKKKERERKMVCPTTSE